MEDVYKRQGYYLLDEGKKEILEELLGRRRKIIAKEKD